MDENMEDLICERYLLSAKIGEGEFGEVYSANDLRLQRNIAIKIFKGEYACREDYLRGFTSDVQSLVRLKHPNVAQVYDLGFHGERPFMVMEKYEESLRDYISTGMIPIVKSLRFADQMLDALTYLHGMNLLHLDIKPSNLLLTNDRSNIVLSDPAIRPIHADLEMTTSGPRGTVRYMSPEQLEGEHPDHRSDIYQAGLVLYEMLTGKLPTPLSTMVPSRRNSNITPGLDAIVLRALEPDPSRRYQNAEEMRSDIKKITQQPFPVDVEKRISSIGELPVMQDSSRPAELNETKQVYTPPSRRERIGSFIGLHYGEMSCIAGVAGLVGAAILGLPILLRDFGSDTAQDLIGYGTLSFFTSPIITTGFLFLHRNLIEPEPTHLDLHEGYSTVPLAIALFGSFIFDDPLHHFWILNIGSGLAAYSIDAGIQKLFHKNFPGKHLC